MVRNPFIFGRVLPPNSPCCPRPELESAILEKRGGEVLFRERFMRLWLLGRLLQNPSMFPAAMTFESEWLLEVRPFVAPAIVRTSLPHSVRR